MAIKQNKRQNKGFKTRKVPRTAKKVQDKSQKSFESETDFYTAISTYEEALIMQIINSRGVDNIDESSVLFNKIISSITPNLNKLSYNYGIYVGKEIYRIYVNKDRIYKTNPMLGLIDFLERIGYSIIYTDFDGDIKITISGDPSFNLKSNLHTFEAGIMSGFIGAVERKLIRFKEDNCIFNNSKNCSFTIGKSKEPKIPELSKSISEFSKFLALNRKKGMNAYYNYLICHFLLHKEFKHEMEEIMYRCGSYLSIDKNNNPKKIINLLNLGKVNIINDQPLYFTIKFDPFLAKKEFVDITFSLIKGFLNTKKGKKFSAIEEINNNIYTIKIKEILGKPKEIAGKPKKPN